MRHLPGFKFIKSLGGISEYRLLKNGLQVLLMEDHSSPTATLMVTYRVGSRNEAVGHTGATHLLEHLMFKGSKHVGENIWNLQKLGGEVNATTWLDRTNYFEVIPARHLELAIKVEADRMRQAMIRKEDLEAEMTVVRNEFERGENSPQEALWKELWATAFREHPYHHPVIGWRSDVENVSIEKLKYFYDTFYWPNNATLSVIGNIETGKILNLIKKHFGKISPAPRRIPEVYTEEPKQEGPRRFVLRRHGEPSMLAIGWKISEGAHPDIYSLQLLETVLSAGKSSRLFRALVDKGLATSIQASSYPTRNPGLFCIFIMLTPGTKHEVVEKIVLENIGKLKKDAVSGQEFSRAKRILEAGVAFTRDGSYAVSSYLAEAIAIGDWTIFPKFFENIEKVKSEDVKRVAVKYFTTDQSTTGWFVSKNK